MWLDQRRHAMLQLHPRYRREITNKVLIMAVWNRFPPETPDTRVMLKSYFQDSQANTMRVMETYQCGSGNICLIEFTDHWFCTLTLNWWSLKKNCGCICIYAYKWVHKCLHVGDYWPCILTLNGASLSINFVCINIYAYAEMHLCMPMGERI